MFPTRATILSRGLALFLAPLACVAQEIEPGTLHEVPPKELPVLQEVAFDVQCEGPVAEPKAVPNLKPPTYLPGQVSSPKLPEEARRAGKGGFVVVKLLVTEKGRVARAQLLRSTGYPDLDQVALTHTGKWKLVPGRVEDKPVCAWGVVGVHFEKHQARTNR